MNVQFVRATALYPYGYFVQWALPSVDPAEVGPFQFELFRSGGPEGPWEPLMTGQDQYAYQDKFNATPSTLDNLQPNQMRLFQRVYYRVVCHLPSGTTIETVQQAGPQAPDRKMQQYLRKLQRDFRLSLKFNGTPVALLKKRRWGPRCPKCYDKRSKEVVRPNCRDCFGTGFVSGFWNAVLTYGRRSVTANTTSIGPLQKGDAADATFWLPDYPALERDDIIVSLREQQRFRVDMQVETEIQLNGVHQEVTCQVIPHDHVVYKLLVDPVVLAPLY